MEMHSNSSPPQEQVQSDDRRTPRRFIAAVAFEMFHREYRDATVPSQEYSKFYRAVARRLKIELDDPESKDQFDRLIGDNANARHSMLTWSQERISFRDRSIMEMFAAVWLAYWCQDEQRSPDDGLRIIAEELGGFWEGWTELKRRQIRRLAAQILQAWRRTGNSDVA
jgi:hypothetical protein